MGKDILALVDVSSTNNILRARDFRASGECG